ncbi:hypothetical protein J2T57_001669 [Natronocella acetinitrilica]|uniref:Uncharacterized protein n=1 Tax=Natronocella acetinitrilica TaxID=414046 RepID=A0AAE3G355_9GAMM|nr:hypothetical protein [Natronocella acetinitrilica]MCP1674567.1 hypothetical protein [Natronocella acetinitrilica]
MHHDLQAMICAHLAAEALPEVTGALKARLDDVLAASARGDVRGLSTAAAGLMRAIEALLLAEGGETLLAAARRSRAAPAQPSLPPDHYAAPAPARAA